MKKAARQLTVILMSLGLLLQPNLILAAEEEDFNPNFLLSDEELQAHNSMTRADIQAFLDEQGGYIAKLRTADKDGTIRAVSDIIYRASQEHRINPKYSLVKLQKEQSLITDRSPSQDQLDWATGYSICDSCSKSDPTLQKNRGFGKQVDSGAGIMRWYYDNLSTEPWIKRTGRAYAIDGTRVVPASLATGFLYTYTPHIHGNRNFWLLWQKWFEQVYPDGTLVKAQNDSTVYLIQNGKKRAFANMTALLTRFDPKLIVTAPPSELNRYEEAGDIKLPNYAIVKSAGRYYLLDNEYARPFANFDVVKKLGYHPDEIIDIDGTELASYKPGQTIGEGTESPLGRVVRVKENKKYYYLTNTQYQPISDAQMLETNYSHLSVESVSATALHDLVPGENILFKDGTIFGVKGSNKIYVVEKGKKRHIANEDVYNGLGYDWSNILWTDEFTGLNHLTGQPIYLRREVQVAENPDVIEVVTNDKMIRTPEAETTYVGERYTTDINTYLVADASGAILAGKNIDDKRPIASFTKVMTAYQLMREGVNLSRSTTYDPADHKSIYHRFRIAPGEKVLNKHLLQAMLTSSLNTPAKMLVDSVEEDQFAFIRRMNGTVDELKLAKTNFDDPTGGGLGNVSTAREYLTIYRRATDNVDVRAYLGATSYQYDELLDLDGKPHHFDTHSNRLTERSGLPYRIITSKTGYLEESGDNLAMEVERNSDGKRFFIITMGNPDHTHRFDGPADLTQWVMDNL